MENIKNYFFELCSDNAPSGREDLLCSLERIVTPLADKVYRDRANNLIAVKYCGIPGAQKIMLDAHADEIGLMVTSIDENGFIHFANHAGIDNRILPASTVTVIGKRNLTGVIATLPPHLLKDSDTSKLVEAKDMVIDVGFDADTVKRLVRIGDLITLRSDCTDLLNGLVMGKSFDNRASCAVLLGVLSMLKCVKPRYDVYFVFSAGEEVGGYGASIAAFDIQPDEAIVLDVTFGVSPYTNSENAKKLGEGAAIGVSPILNNHIIQTLVGSARSRSIPYQLEIMNGKTGTNADKIVMSRGGVPCALISIPLRYMHSASEVVCMSDLENALRLVLNYVEYRGGVFGE